MLLIRKQQMQALSAAQVRKFEDRCIKLIQIEWKDDYAVYEEARLRILVQELLQLGTAWDFHTERERFRLINIGAFVGLGFQHENRYSWAVQILGDRTLPLAQRIEAVFDHADTLESQ